MSRAELARLFSALPHEQVQAAAKFCGFVAIEEPSTAAQSTVIASALPPPPAPPPAFETAPLPLYRLEQMVFAEDADDDLTTAAPVSPGLSPQELISHPGSLFVTPARPALTPWSRLWPVLRAALHGRQRGRDLDLRECLHRLGRGQIMQALPRVQRPVWADRVELWVDRSQRLTPFWSDQDEVCIRLLRCCGKSGLRLRILDSQEQAESIPTQGDLLPDRRGKLAQRVLVLSDLGAYASRLEQRAWQRTASRLRRMDVQVAALLPVPPGRVPKELARSWSAVSWERGSPSGQVHGLRSVASGSARAERLLRLCAPAAYVQLGLLRALRRLLPACETDAGTEADVFAHRLVRAADAMGLVLSPEPAASLRQQFFAQEPEPLQAKVSETIRQWHQGLPPELLRVETLSWLALGSAVQPPGETSDALAFAERLGSSLREGFSNPQVTSLVKRCARVMLSALPDRAYQDLPLLQPIFAGAYAGVSGVRVPEGLSPKLLYSELVWAPDRVFWSVRQVGAELLFKQEPGPAWPSASPAPGSPVAWLQARNPHVTVKWNQEGFARQQILTDGLSLPLRFQQTVEIRSDCCTVTIAPWQREPWATAAGRDRYGLWADASIEGIAVRFRYIPPGRFLMGSPESETGRDEDEGPQHEVTWTQGYWLAETPCTQAVWEQVMGGNPSRFASAERPVEQVSWDDCQEFVKRLNERNPGLLARLPSEAEWEHACRAGTHTATWVGDFEILGECNAPLLDEIAWYKGNSGQDYELAKGVDSSSWPDKQYPHTKAGTHEVRKKQANPHGLYDLLGNTWEWCLDMHETYKAQAVTNPAPSTMGTVHVDRGGSWFGLARFVRAACRGGVSPDYSSFGVGVRLARGQGGWEAGTRSGPVGRGEGLDPAASALREAETTPARSADQK